MERVRSPFEGVTNIVKFNRQYYLLSLLLILAMVVFNRLTLGRWEVFILSLLAIVLVPTITSLLVSFYVYDLSGLYSLNWLNGIEPVSGDKIVNITAGFDETSFLLNARYPAVELIVLDFYDRKKHTEISIERARKTYAPFPGTRVTSTARVLLPDNSIASICITLAAHEIRNDRERTVFFKELGRILKPEGRIYITEHQRDFANFLAYNIGFFHFLSPSTWRKTFSEAGLTISDKISITPFITTFVLRK